MHELFEATKLTEIGVTRNRGFLDWNTQPSRFKHYPRFCFRYTREALGEHAWLLDMRRITERLSVGGKPYERLSVPSAGNLHPIELYVQLRNLKGIMSGIYHIDTQDDTLVLIRDIESEGLEPALGIATRFRGVIVLTSLVPFRSFWKYGARSWRYLFLDAGHQCAALQMQRPDATLLSGFDAPELNELMGFGAYEFTCNVITIGEESGRKVIALPEPLMEVMPTDYSGGFEEIKAVLSQQINLESAYEAMAQWPTIEALHAKTSARRSAREFSGAPLKSVEVERFMNFLKYHATLHVSMVLLRTQGYKSGVYYQERVRVGFAPDVLAQHLVSQRFCAQAAMVVCLHTREPDATAHLHAGMIAQQCYLLCESMGLGCSGIGAYYDDALRAFIETDDEIVYVIAIGAR